MSVRTIEKGHKRPKFAEVMRRGKAKGRISIRRADEAAGMSIRIRAVLNFDFEDYVYKSQCAFLRGIEFYLCKMSSRRRI
jgi:hypothetical protein